MPQRHDDRRSLLPLVRRGLHPATIGEEGLGTQQPLTPLVGLDCARDRVDQSFFASRADSRASCFVFRLPCRHSARDFSSPFLHSALASRAP
jgi:hypothetical protein